jgi:hypothetical protein
MRTNVIFAQLKQKTSDFTKFRPFTFRHLGPCRACLQRSIAKKYQEIMLLYQNVNRLA